MPRPAYLETQLAQLGLEDWDAALMRAQDGVELYRLSRRAQSLVLKYFARAEFRREIENYRILQSLGIPTIPLLGATGESILLEDLTCSPTLRLGLPEDLADPGVARALGGWYKTLHQQGRTYVKDHGGDLYDEADLLTPEAFQAVQERTKTAGHPAWRALEARYDLLFRLRDGAERTLTYNDFYYTNLAVAKDGSAALMFDYNLLGKGYVYADLRNVLYHMTTPARDAFLAAYGPYDPREERLDRLLSPLTTLVLSSPGPDMPPWAAEALDEVLSGSLASQLEEFSSIM